MAAQGRNIYVGMAVSVLAGLAFVMLLAVQRVVSLDSPWSAMPFPMAIVMGFAGSFWWWRPKGKGPGLFTIIVLELMWLGLFYSVWVLWLRGVSESTAIALIIYLIFSPAIFIGMLIGGGLGFAIMAHRRRRARRRRVSWSPAELPSNRSRS